MKLLICGSRNWTNQSTIEKFLTKFKENHPDVEVIHGDCRGADKTGAYIAKKLGMNVTAFPADWEKHGRVAGPIRNQQMIDEKPDYVVAFRGHTSNGTKNLINLARRNHILVGMFVDTGVS